jgi:hypothetical protein
VSSTQRFATGREDCKVFTRVERRAAAEAFRRLAEERLGGELGCVIERRDSILEFECRVGKWYIVTTFDTGRAWMLSYNQTVFAAPGGQLGTNLSKGISILRWLGIFNGTFWSDSLPNDIPHLIDNLGEFCLRFLSATPKLLEGLEPSLSDAREG